MGAWLLKGSSSDDVRHPVTGVPAWQGSGCWQAGLRPSQGVRLAP